MTNTLETRTVTRTLIAIAFGGACGAVFRYAVVSLVAWWGGHVWGTVLVNLVGSFAIGAIVASASDTSWFESFGRPFLVVGDAIDTDADDLAVALVELRLEARHRAQLCRAHRCEILGR